MKLTKKATTDQIKQLTAPRIQHLWGQPHMVTPHFIERPIGDGLQLAFLQPMNTRPNFYVLQVDSSINLNEEDQEFNGAYIGGLFVNLVASECHDRDDYEENENGLLFDPYDEDVEPFESEFPVLSIDCGYSYGEIDDDDFVKKPTS